MKYIVHRRFKRKCICGEVNLPASTPCDSDGIVISMQGNPLCYVDSENAHQYFAINDDGCGMERGMLTQAIQKTLSKRDAFYQERWNKIWSDGICQQCKRKDYDDYWLWGQAFFDADITVLRHIATLVGAKCEGRNKS